MNESRILEIERRLGQMARDLEAARQMALQALQQYPRAWAQNQPSGGGDGKLYWAKIISNTSAGGAWPALTAGTFTSDVYENIGGTFTLKTSGATLYWWYHDDVSSAGALVPCMANADGSFEAITASCTTVV